MKKNYFVLDDADDNNHLGVVVAENDAELNEKVKQAIETHYVCTVNEPINLSIDDLTHNCALPIEIEVAVVEDGEDYVRCVEVRETWIY